MSQQRLWPQIRRIALIFWKVRRGASRDRSVRDPEIVNQILEDTQGLDRYRQRQEELLRQASLVTDAYERSVFISMIDPGRAMTVLGTREDMKLIES